MSEKSYNMIIVDNDETSSEILKYYLTKVLKHNVKCIFDNGKDFLKSCNNIGGEIDLVLIDVEMPFMSGYETGKYFNFTNKTYMMVVTKNENSLDLENLIMNGFRGAILKSEITTDLKKAITRIMDGGYYFNFNEKKP